MKLTRKNLMLKNFAYAALLLAAAIALGWLAARYPLQRDLTQGASNSLEPVSVQALQQLPGPVQIRVFSPEQDAKQADMRKLIRQFVGLYQRYKSDITLDFMDPAQHPEEARKAEIQANGEMVVEYDGRREHLSMLNEQVLTSALLSLAHRQQQLVMYVDGHGERKLEGIANFDLGDFGKRLGKLGFRMSSLNLAVAQDVPDNASLLVITQPQVDWLPGEVDKLMRYVDHGGNILWLLDAEPMHGLEPLAEKLGLSLVPGIVIDPDAQQLRVPPTWTLGANYPPHAITRDFGYPTVFPFARALDHEENQPWHYSTLVDAAPRGWVSENPPKGNTAPKFNKNRDEPGPVVIALALEREVDHREQRIVAVGSGAFLSNQYSGNLRNLDLGVNMVNWLGKQDNLIFIPPRAAKDDTVTLSWTQLGIISVGLIIVLPVAFALVGGALWWHRRR
ncbi:MAG TPA: GldG family protein [Gallionellaceae bacterium]